MMMWILTVYSEGKIPALFEYNTEKEALDAFNKVKGCKILSEVIYYNDTKIS
ncbi:hypothetical protein AB7942_20125 [Neobacillus sp. BF23-41]|uniref:hypothetical protein n=1 Tax=Neobacillus sp. BF23-41 TaxID=3240280 RepID=UPI0034E5D2D7